MTFNINEYSQGLPLPQYKKTDYSLELEMAVLSKKAQEQQKALDKINQMQRSALSITMLNLEGKERLDGYNKRLSEELSKDPGDLTKLENQNRIATLFQDIAGDKELMTLSKQSRELINQKDISDREKASGKANTINEFVFLNDEGGYYDFMQMSAAKGADPNFRPAKYTTYTDIKTPIANLSKLLHEDIYQTETQGLTGTPEEIAAGKAKLSGYIESHIFGGVAPERIKALAEAQLGPAGMAQLEVMAKYDIIRTKQAGQNDALYNQYEAYAQKEVNAYKFRKDEIEQKIKYFDSVLNDSKSSDSQKTEAQAMKEAHLKALPIVTANLDNLTTSIKTRDEFSKMSVRELTPYIYQLKREEMLTDVANALSWKKDVRTLREDKLYMQARQLDFTATQNQLNRDTDIAKTTLRITASQKAKEAEPLPWSQTDVAQNKVNLLSSYDKVVSLQNEYAQKTGALITANASGSFDTNLLRENKFKETFKNLGSNYEIQMWDKFKTLKPDLAYNANGEPQIESFKIWVADQEKNPVSSVAPLVEQQKYNRYISDGITEELAFMNGALRGASESVRQLKGYARNKDGSVMTDSDFAAGKEIYLTVPTINKYSTESDLEYRQRGGDYKLVSLDQYKKDIKEGKYDREVKEEIPVFVSSTGQVSGGTRFVKKFVPTDAGLYSAIQNYDTAIKDPTLLKVLEERLTQFEQYGQVMTSDKDAIRPYEGQINTALRLASANSGFAGSISVDDIKTVIVPVGSGTTGFYTLEEAAVKRIKEAVGEDKAATFNLPTEDGLAGLDAGKRYTFTTTPVEGRDALLNMTARSRPYKENYKGFEFSILNDNSGKRFITIKNSAGKTVTLDGADVRGDIYRKILEVKSTIDNFAANKQAETAMFGN